MNKMEWISLNDRLPIIPPGEYQSVKAVVCWGKQWAEMSYARRTVRGKEVERWEWYGRINIFPITHWAIPTLPKNE